MLTKTADAWVYVFAAMASPCQVIVDADDPVLADRIGGVAEEEARRIERKFSRYRDDNIVAAINAADGAAVDVDPETAQLLDFAAACHALSGGLFDITSGVLRRVWRFDGGTHVPSRRAVHALLDLVGWEKVDYDGAGICLPAGMQIDFGGIGKEYAVDRVAALLSGETERPFLVNFGGDLYASGERPGGRPWGVGIDDPSRTGEAVLYRVELRSGGLATSGDARRFVLHQGRRLGHILDPRTGWPVADAPQAITVIASTCLEAGTLSTLAYLQGRGAEEFLVAQGVQFQLT